MRKQVSFGRNVAIGKFRRAYMRGFTLLELLVTIAVLAILVALAVPSFTSIFNSNRLAAQSNEVVAALQMARSEAIKQNRRAVVCRSINGTSCAGSNGTWDQFITAVDLNGNRLFDAAEVVRVNAVKAPIQVKSGNHSILFRADGMARTDNAVATLVEENLTICIPTAYPPQNQRVVSLSTGSRISTKSDGNGNGVCP